ncbi:MAG: hypothetical protein QOJ05_1683 [Verrucomicrobiota bacterium]|jgi:hypothetical protein
MNPDADRKPEPVDSENLLRTLDLELMRQRTARQQEGTPYRSLRLASFVFLFAVVLGAAFAFYYVFIAGGLDEMRARNEPHATATPSSRAP